MAQGLSNGCAGLLVFLCVSSMCVHTSQHWYKLEESQNGQSSGKITSVQEDPWTSALPKGDEWRGNRGSLANAQAQVHTHSHCEGADFRRPRRHRCLRFCILQINGQRSHLDSVEYAVLRTRQSSSSLPECQTQGSVQGVSWCFILLCGCKSGYEGELVGSHLEMFSKGFDTFVGAMKDMLGDLRSKTQQNQLSSANIIKEMETCRDYLKHIRKGTNDLKKVGTNLQWEIKELRWIREQNSWRLTITL